MVNADSLRELLLGRSEWLLVRELGKTFPLYASEIEVTTDEKRARIAFLDDKGFHAWRLNGFALDGGEIAVDVAGVRSKKRETIRLVPRLSAADVTTEIQLARLEKANEIAALLAANHSG